MRRKLLVMLMLCSRKCRASVVQSLCDANSWSLPDYTHVPEIIVPRSLISSIFLPQACLVDSRKCSPP